MPDPYHFLDDKVDVEQCGHNKILWERVFNIVRPEYEAWWLADRNEIFQDLLEEIQEWIEGSDDSFSQYDLSETYKQLLNCWKNRKEDKYSFEDLADQVEEVSNQLGLKD